MKQENLISFALWVVVAIIAVWFFSPFVKTTKEPEYIRRDFKNGNSIEVEVDEELTSDNSYCKGDCSGHLAGYEWAEDKGITDPSDCGGYSESFIEGCMVYANEN